MQLPFNMNQFQWDANGVGHFGGVAAPQPAPQPAYTPPVVQAKGTKPVAQAPRVGFVPRPGYVAPQPAPAQPAPQPQFFMQQGYPQQPTQQPVQGGYAGGGKVQRPSRPGAPPRPGSTPTQGASANQASHYGSGGTPVRPGGYAGNPYTMPGSNTSSPIRPSGYAGQPPMMTTGPESLRGYMNGGQPPQGKAPAGYQAPGGYGTMGPESMGYGKTSGQQPQPVQGQYANPQRAAAKQYGPQPQAQPYTGTLSGPNQQQPGIQTSVNPTGVFDNRFMNQTANLAAAQAVPAAADLRQQFARSGFSGQSGAIQGGMGAAVGQAQANAAYAPAAVQNQMGWANAQNYLQGQQRRDQEAQGWAGMANQGMANRWQNQNQQQGQVLNFLGGAYRSM